ncbi:flagellar biosynthesis anti-sigma factor FlgM [Parashewanella curva]|uniref:Negative regulator of flagellin synthesis n=1 Tax=Parashewanella curva TaxID=2338552 RepID=A0A3L8Q3T7_9GAMM|nr:flagellar biosynthesis anti-sigma factor FlgM [Parashewanella curva]RLV61582.1 flagellar biosynthesis anti-sigma factor FlgM [Parashewanella curva]
MPIDTNKLNPSLNNRVQVRKAAVQNESTSQPKAANDAPRPVKGDSVQLTAQAQQLQRMQTRMSLMSDVDHDKVSGIKQAIAEGRYKIDAESLAKNIASFESELNALYKDKNDNRVD